MSDKFFPEIITSLPNADIPIKGLGSYLFQGENQQILFMEFENDAEVPEHSHEAQWGVVLAGEIELFIDDEKFTFRKGDTYFIPAGAKHSAKIKAGYKDLTLFNQKDRYKIRAPKNR
ncbi:MAG: cupin domain-containing protein [Deltaproteobacteria bacterium]|nr:cupin domain-containing protein [Deltaproteobacteria bacterium]MBW2019821.1 cupin domain-containing protein [Deltaproteobacteria bacterium]MBW2074627.1 cupin domain-containing protein [Deltaproteobacteria bacterium]